MSLDFIKVSLSYISTKYVVLVLNFLRSLIIASALGPSTFGEYAFIVIIMEYMNYSNLGIFHAMNKEVAINLDKQGKGNYIDRIINNTISFQSLNSLFIGVLLLIPYLLEVYNFINNPFFDSKYLLYLIFLGTVYQIKSFVFVYLRLYDKFFDIVKIEFLSAIFVFIGIYFSVNQFGISAILLVSIIGNLIMIAPALLKIRFLRFEIEKSILKHLISLAIPLMLFNFLVLIITSIDRLMISFLMPSNKTSLGIFHFGYLLSYGVMTAFNSAVFLLVPKVLRQFSQKSQDVDLMVDQTKIVENIVVLIAVISIALFPYIINTFVPQYLESILVMQLLLLAYSINSLSFLTGNHLIANDLQLRIVPIFVFALIVAVLMNYLSINAGYGLRGIAIATILTFSFYSYGTFLVYLQAINNKKPFSFLINIFWRIFIFTLIAALFLLSESNPIWVVILYLIFYGVEAIKLVRKYLPFLSLR